jgi:hypothetical protein
LGENVKNGLISIVWMIGIVILAAWFDQRYASMERGAVYRPHTIMWVRAVFTMIISAAVIWLAWFAVFNGERNKIVAVTFLATGLLFLVAPLILSYFWSGTLADMNVVRLMVPILTSGMGLASTAMGFIAVIGWIGLTTFGQIEFVEAGSDDNPED